MAAMKINLTQKRTCTINVNIVWDCSYKNLFNTKISRSTIMTLLWSHSYTDTLATQEEKKYKCQNLEKVYYHEHNNMIRLFYLFWVISISLHSLSKL